MKSLFFLILLTSMTSFASGKFIFMPEANYTKNESAVHMGLSVYEKIAGPFSFAHYSGTMIHKDKADMTHHFHDFTMSNALVTHLGEKLDLEFGHKMLYNKHDKYTEHKGFVKVSAQLW